MLSDSHKAVRTRSHRPHYTSEGNHFDTGQLQADVAWNALFGDESPTNHITPSQGNASVPHAILHPLPQKPPKPFLPASRVKMGLVGRTRTQLGLEARSHRDEPSIAEQKSDDVDAESESEEGELQEIFLEHTTENKQASCVSTTGPGPGVPPEKFRIPGLLYAPSGAQNPGICIKSGVVSNTALEKRQSKPTFSIPGLQYPPDDD